MLKRLIVRLSLLSRRCIVPAIVLVVAALVASTAWATGAVQQTADNPNISVDTARDGGTGAFTPLLGPVVVEINNQGMSHGSMILNAPSGFEFDTTANSVTVTVTGTEPLAYINTTDSNTGEARSAHVTPTTLSITIFITSASTGQGKTTFTWSGIKVRPLNGASLAAGNITYSGTSNGLPTGTIMGTLAVVPGTLHHFSLSTVNSPQTVGSPFALAITAQDQFNNTVTNFSGTADLTVSGGSSITPAHADDFTSGVWTGTVTVTGGGTARAITVTQNGGSSSATNAFNVDKIAPTVNAWPAASAITIGQAWSSSTLTGGEASVSGSFAFTAPATVPGAAGSSSASVTFTPADTSNYSSVTGSVTVTVNSAAPGTTTVNTGANVLVTPTPEVSLKFNNVTNSGSVSVTQDPSPQTPSANFRVITGSSYLITSNVTYSDINVCLGYDEEALADHGNEVSIKMYHYNGQIWEDVTSSVDTADNKVCGTVTSLSPVVLVEPSGSGGSGAIPVPVMNGWWLLPGILAGIGMFARRRKG